MIGVHARLILERPEAIECQNENDFADCQNNNLGGTAGLDRTEGDSAHEGYEDWYESERSCNIAVRIVKRAVEEYRWHVIEEKCAWLRRKDDP